MWSAQRFWSRLLVSVAIGVVLAWLALRGGLPLLPDLRAFATVSPWTVPIYVLSLSVMHGLRAARFRFLVRPVRTLSLRDTLALNFVGFLAIFALPLRLGEFVRPALGRTRYSIPWAAGLGTVAVERVVDGLLTSGCVAAALWLLPRSGTVDPIARHVPTYARLAVAAFGAGFAALLLFVWQRQLARRLCRGALDWLSPQLGAAVEQKLVGIADGLRALQQPRLGFGFLFESLAYWGVNALGVWWLGVGCGLPGFTFVHAIAVMGILAIGILLPSGPGLFGTFQLAVAGCLRMYFPEQVVAQQGAAFIFLLYAAQSLVMIVAGVAPVLFDIEGWTRSLFRLRESGRLPQLADDH